MSIAGKLRWAKRSGIASRAVNAAEREESMRNEGQSSPKERSRGRRRALLNVIGTGVSTSAVVGLLVLDCTVDPTKNRDLAIPFIQQQQTTWCAAACVQMWGKWLNPGSSTSQSDIAYVVGWYGANIPGILEALRRFCNIYAFDLSYPEAGSADQPNIWQDKLMASQADGLLRDRPSIPILNGDQPMAHAVLWRGFSYREDSDGRPVILAIKYNDPVGSEPVTQTNIDFYKSYLFVPRSRPDYTLFYTVVMDNSLSRSKIIARGTAGLDEFIARQGRFRGGPYAYDPWRYDVYPRRIY